MGWLANVANNESGGNPNAHNSASSAKGLFQFTQPTWASYLQSPDAKAKGYGPGDITNPKASTDGAVWLAGQNSNALSAAGFPNLPPGALAAAHVLGAGDTIAMLKAASTNANATTGSVLSASDPNANAVFAGNPSLLNPGDTVGQTLQKFGQYASGSYPSGGGQLASNGASDVPLTGGTPGTAGTGSPGATLGGFPSIYQKMLGSLPQAAPLPQAPQQQGSPQLLGKNFNYPMLGLEAASGLLGAHTLGQGLSGAFGNLTGGYQQQMQTANSARQTTVADNNAAAQSNFANKLGLQQTGNEQAMNRANTALQLAQYMRPKPLGYQPVQQADGSWAQPMIRPDGSTYMNPLGAGVTPGADALAKQRAQDQAQNQSALQTQKTGDQEHAGHVADSYKQSVGDLATYRSIANSAVDQAQNANNVLGLLGPNAAAVGPTAGAGAVRWLAKTFGIAPGGVTANGLGLTQQGADELKTSILPTLKTMGITRIAGPELNFLGSVVPNHDVSLQALQAMASEIRDESQRRITNMKAWDALPPDQQAAVMASPTGAGGWFSDRTRQAYGISGNNSNPGSSVSPTGNYEGTAGYNSQGAPSSSPGGPSQAPSGQPASATQGPPLVDSQSAFDALPRGGLYTDRFGNTRQKP